MSDTEGGIQRNRGSKSVTADRLSWIISGLNFDSLTDWEEGFVESAENYFKHHGDLTKKQEETLERIFKEKSR